MKNQNPKANYHTTSTVSQACTRYVLDQKNILGDPQLQQKDQPKSGSYLTINYLSGIPPQYSQNTFIPEIQIRLLATAVSLINDAQLYEQSSEVPEILARIFEFVDHPHFQQQIHKSSVQYNSFAHWRDMHAPHVQHVPVDPHTIRENLCLRLQAQNRDASVCSIDTKFPPLNPVVTLNPNSINFGQGAYPRDKISLF